MPASRDSLIFNYLSLEIKLQRVGFIIRFQVYSDLGLMLFVWFVLGKSFHQTGGGELKDRASRRLFHYKCLKNH